MQKLCLFQSSKESKPLSIVPFMVNNIHENPILTDFALHNEFYQDNFNTSCGSLRPLQNIGAHHDQIKNMFGMVEKRSTICKVHRLQNSISSVGSAIEDTIRMPREISMLGIEKLQIQTPLIRSKGRAILTKDQAREIFLCRPDEISSIAIERARAAFLSKKYGVSVKTVRDIWIGRTWYRATFHLDPSKPIAAERLQRQPGRPKGAKDRQPRTRKMDKGEVCNTDDLLPLSRLNSTSSGLESSAQPSRHKKQTASLECPSTWNSQQGDLDVDGIRVDEAGIWDRDSLPAFDTHSKSDAPAPAAMQPHAPSPPPPATAACEWQITSVSSPTPSQETFVDPFHDDWPF